MTNAKLTRRALLSSVLALVLCFTMLLGTTFAWFTDEAVSGGNKIIAGNLEVDLVDANGTSLVGNAELFVSADGKTSSDILWEPGATYNTIPMYVKNNGNLALKYQFIVNVTGDDAATLLNAITFTVKVGDTEYGLDEFTGELATAGETSDAIVISGHMDENAGNEYKNLEATLSITVFATQLAHESDSFDNKYDVTAPADQWDGTADDDWYDAESDEFILTTAEELAGLSALVADGNNFKGKTVKLAYDIDLKDQEWTPIDGFAGTFDGNGKTISNLTVTGTENAAFFSHVYTTAAIKDVTFDNANISGNHYVAVVLGYETNNGTNAKIQNVTVKNSTVTVGTDANDDNGDKVGGIVGYATTVSIDGCTVENSTIIGYRDVGGIIGYASALSYGEALAVTNNTVKNVTLVCNNKCNYKGYTSADEYDINTIVGEATQYAVVKNNTEENVTFVAGAISSGRVEHTGSRYQIAADFAATGVEKLAVKVLDQNGNVLTTITPEGYNIPDDGVIGNFTEKSQSSWVTVCAAITGNSSSWQNTLVVPSMDAVPTTMVLVVNDFEVAKCGVSQNSYPNGKTWEEVVGATVATVDNVNDLRTALADGKIVVLTDSVTAEAIAGGYSKAGVVVANGAVLDGNGETLTITDANDTWGCAVNVTGGTVKNLTITGAMRGIFVSGGTADIIIDNCVLDNVIYTFNSDAGNKNYSVTIKNTTLNGWTSFSDVHKSVDFTDCKFGEGNGYAFCRPFQAVTFKNCEFEAGYVLDISKTTGIVLDNCTIGGTLVTADNIEDLIGGSEDAALVSTNVTIK